MSVRGIGPVLLAAAALAGTARANGAAASPAPKFDDPHAASLRRGDAYAHLIEAGLAVGRGRSGDAVREVDAAVALEPDSAGLQAQAAEILAMLGRRADAERLARRALELDPKEIDAVRVLADLSAARAFGPKADPAARDEAIRLYSRLSAEDPDAPDEIWSALARLKLAAGDGEGAAADARKLLDRRPGDPNAVRLLDQTLVSAGKTKEALERTLAWLKDHPDNDDLLPLVVEMARDTGDWARLEAICGTLLAKDPDNARARGLRGEARLRQGHPKEALDDLEIARTADSEDPTVRLHLAAAYQALNRLADATQMAEGLAAEYPDNTFVRLLLADTLARRGETGDARSAYLAALASVPSEAPDGPARRDELRLRLIALELAARHTADAGTTAAALERPDAPEAVSARARIAMLSGDPKEAKRLSRLLAPSDPAEAALVEGEAELKLGHKDRAVERFSAAVAKAGPAARGDVATILRRNGLDADAETELRGWIAETPKDATARLALGAFLERAGRFDAAEPELREAIALDPASAEALNYLGYSLADRGQKLDEAVTLIRKALDIDPWNGAYLDSLGWAYFKQGKLGDAVRPLEAAAREFPNDPAVLEHLGDVYARQGDEARAKSFWKRALDAGPDDPKARGGLERKLGSASTPAADEANSRKPAS